MSRWTFTITDKLRKGQTPWRQWIARKIMEAPVGYRVTLQEPKRTNEQSNLMWDMLSDVSTQLTWFGNRYPPEHWKDWFMHHLEGELFMPDEQGGMTVPIGWSSSKLSKPEMGDLIELIAAFGARYGVEFGKYPPEKQVAA